MDNSKYIAGSITITKDMLVLFDVMQHIREEKERKMEAFLRKENKKMLKKLNHASRPTPHI